MPGASASCRTDGGSGVCGRSMDSRSWCSNFAGQHGSATFCSKCTAHRRASTFFLRVQRPATSAAAPGADHQCLRLPASTPRRRPASTPRRRRCPDHPLPQRQDHQHPALQRVLQSQGPSSALRTSSPPARPASNVLDVPWPSHGHARCAGRCHGAAAAAPVQRGLPRMQRGLPRNSSNWPRAKQVSGRRLS